MTCGIYYQMGGHRLQLLNRNSNNCYSIYLSMSDSTFDIFEYPDDAQLSPRKTKQVDTSQRTVIIKQNTEKRKDYYFDKRTFDYEFMFLNVAHLNRHTQRYEDSNINGNAVSPQNRHNKTQEQEIPSGEDSEDRKSNQSKNQSRILDRLQEGEEIAIPVQKDATILSEKELSDNEPPNMEQNPNQTQVIEDDPSNLNESNKQMEKAEDIQSSQIEDLSADFANGLEKSQQQESQSMARKQEQNSSIHQSNFYKKEIGIEGSLEISSIKPNTEAEEIINLLNQFHENDSDGDELENKQDLGEKLQRVEKIRSMESLELQNLVYTLNTVNCRKILIRSMLDFDDSKLKINKPRPVKYLAINQRTLQVSNYEVDQLKWQVAKSKIILQPLQLTVKCYSCGTKCKNVIVTDRECLTLCTNSECTKQITIEFVDISLGAN